MNSELDSMWNWHIKQEWNYRNGAAEVDKSCVMYTYNDLYINISDNILCEKSAKWNFPSRGW
jgi:hypothetical protein